MGSSMFLNLWPKIYFKFQGQGSPVWLVPIENEVDLDLQLD